MLALDLFNTDYERRLMEGGVDTLEQRRIDDLAMKMDDLAARAKEPAYQANPKALAALMKEFKKCKDERDSYYKVKTNEGSMKDAMWRDAERMSREQFCSKWGDENGEFWDNIMGDLDEAGIPGNVPTEKIPGKEDLLKGKGRSYYEEGSEEGWSKDSDWKKIPKDKSGRPVDPRGEVTHLSDVARRQTERQAQQDQKKSSKEVTERGGIPGGKNWQKSHAGAHTWQSQLEDQGAGQVASKALASAAVDTMGAEDTLEAQLGEHGGGIGPKQRWQDLMPEQANTQDDDWSDDEEDQDTELRSGDYVRDTMDGKHGEIFRMQGDPYERRVRILDRDGRGWYIEPNRLTRVDPQDPDVQRYFGKKRVRDMDEASYTPTAGELARDLIKLADADFNKKYGMSKQQANRYYSSSKLKDPGMDEAQKTDNRPASQFDREIVKAQPDGSCELKCGHKTSAKLSKNPVGKKIFCARCYELRNKKEDVAEGMDDDVEHLANVAADAYWSGNFGMTSATEKVKMVRDIVQAVEDGRLSIEELRQDIRDLDNKGVAEGWSDAIVAQRTGSPRTPYSVYIKGKKWKDFETDDHAEAVANKLRAKFKADGRDPSVITIAPTDMSEEYKPVTKPVPQPRKLNPGWALDPTTKAELKRRKDIRNRKGVDEVAVGGSGQRVFRNGKWVVPKATKPVKEEQDSSAVESAILRRIMVAHTDLLKQFGPQKVMQAAEEVAYNVGDVDEIGTSDVSAYVDQVKQILGAE